MSPAKSTEISGQPLDMFDPLAGTWLSDHAIRAVACVCVADMVALLSIPNVLFVLVACKTILIASCTEFEVLLVICE